MNNRIAPSRKRIILSIIICLLTIWLIISAIWFFHFWSYNKYFDENFEHLHGYTSHIDRSTPILYGVWTPVYLDFGGNLSCNSEDQQITILVWPSLFGGDIKQIGLILKSDITYRIYVDSEMNYDISLNPGISAEQDENIKKIMGIKQDEIKELWELMKFRFGIMQ